MSKAMIISVDGHAALPIEDYRPYVESRYQVEFDEMVASGAFMTSNFVDICDPRVFEVYKAAFYDTGVIDGKRDPHRRVLDLASEGIAAEVLFPDGAPFGAGGVGANRAKYSGELELAGARAYNRWIAEFTGAYPERLAAQAIITLWDIGEATKDVLWAAEHGFRGLVMPGVDATPLALWEPAYEPFWSVCEETGLVLNFHGGVGCQPEYPASEGVPTSVQMRVQAFEAHFFAHRPLWWLIWSGVLERHPEMKVVFTEQHSEWIPTVLAKLDHSYNHSKFDEAIKKIVPHRPSEYWARQCFTGASTLSRLDLRLREEIGAKNMMFGADFPHPEGTCMNTLRYLQATVGECGMSVPEAREFLGGTAETLFGFDATALAPIVDEHGYEMDEVLTPLSPESEPEYQHWDVIRP